jgi:hypothetical protein
MPEDWSVTNNEKSINSTGFHFRKSIYLEENKTTVHLDYVYAVTKPFLESNEVKEHLAKVNDIHDNLSFEFSYTKNNVQSAHGPSPYYLIGAICVVALVFALIRLNKYDPEARPSVEQYAQIGGWLIVPALGLAFTPVRMAYEFFDVTFFDISQWKMLADSSYPAYNPPLGLFVLLEFIANIALMCYSVFLCSIYFTRRTSLPLLIVIYYAANVVVHVGDLIGLQVFSLSGDNATTRSMIQAIIGAAIWIPYFLRSERVKGTFVTRY